MLVGQDNGPTPVEFVLHALAARPHRPGQHRRRPTVTEVRSTVSGDIDLNGILGLNPGVRNATSGSPSASRSRVTRRPRSCANSWSSREPGLAVYDVITNQVPVTIEVDTA